MKIFKNNNITNSVNRIMKFWRKFLLSVKHDYNIRLFQHFINVQLTYLRRTASREKIHSVLRANKVLQLINNFTKIDLK